MMSRWERAWGLAGLACLCLSPLVWSGQKPAETDPVVAIVDGTPIHESELGLRTQLLQLDQQAYELRQRALQHVISERLLEKAAKAQNLTVEEFLKQRVDSQVPEPSPQEVEGFYWGIKDKLNRPLDEVREQVARRLKALKTQQARQDFMEKLRKQASVEIFLEPPRVQAEVPDAPRRGPATAPVTITEFADYQCPYCRNVEPVVEELMEKYGDQVSLVYVDLPLTNLHAEAEPAALAAQCARDQGKFWEYHDALFKAARLDSNTFAEIAKSLGLDLGQFQKCQEEGKYRDRINAEVEQARSLGISSTPTFLINGVLLSGAQPLEAFTRIIGDELERANQGTSAKAVK
jgi:protein-disulfide isomerase